MQLAHRKVLVLNKNFTAIGVVSLPRAIVMLFTTDAKGAPKAEVIDNDCTPRTWEQWAAIRPAEGEDAIHACRGEFRIPEIIKLNRYDKLPQQKVHFSRKTIYDRDDRRCQYCKKRFPANELSIDHIVPRSRGGLTEWSNCCLACVYCNKCKADRMPTKKVETVKNETGQVEAVTIFTVYFKDGKKTWQASLRQPLKPKYNIFRCGIHYESWRQWLSESYWNIELENDNKD